MAGLPKQAQLTIRRWLTRIATDLGANSAA